MQRMTRSRRFLRRASSVCAILALAVAVDLRTPAVAQNSGDAGEPVELGPPIKLGPGSGGEAPAGGGQDTGGAITQPGAAIDAETPREGIDIDTMAARDPEFLGVLGAGRGGLGSDLWAGSDEQTLEALAAQLDTAPANPTLHDLARRLMLSAADAPMARSDGDGDLSFLSARADYLLRLGALDDLSALLEVVPWRATSEKLARTRMEALLLSRSDEQACAQAESGLARYTSDFWSRTAIYCQLVQGRTNEAELGLGVLRESGQANSGFFRLASAKARGSRPGRADEPLTPLGLAAAVSFGASLATDVTESANLPELVALCRTEEIELDLQARACERAVQAGALSAGHLREAYTEFGFSVDVLDGAPSRAAELQGVRGRALLYQAVGRQEVPPVRAELLRIALERAQTDGLYLAIARVYAPIVATIEPSMELVWFARPAGRALYADQRYERANAWLQLARQESMINAEAAAAFMALWPYAQLASGQGISPEGNLSAWRSAREDADHAASARQQVLLKICFQALGLGDDLAWSRLASELADPGGSAAAPAPQLWAMADARDSGRRGEALLLALIVMGGQNPAAVHGLALDGVLDTLVQLGLGREARQLAIETALSAGI